MICFFFFFFVLDWIIECAIMWSFYFSSFYSSVTPVNRSGRIRCSLWLMEIWFSSLRLFSSDAGTYKEPSVFFTAKKSLVQDYFDGNLGLVTQTIHSQTFVFVMYYASKCRWNAKFSVEMKSCVRLGFCGISRRMREPYERAAAFYHERLTHENQTNEKFHVSHRDSRSINESMSDVLKVKFVAINCFYHNGQCRKTYKLNYYPHMFLYVKGTRGYQYFGPTMTTNLIEFIEKIRMPLIRLTNLEEFFDFIVQYEVGLVLEKWNSMVIWSIFRRVF